MPDTPTTVHERIAAVRSASPPTPEDARRARLLLADLLTAAEPHGLTLDDFDWVADLPALCLHLARHTTRHRDHRPRGWACPTCGTGGLTSTGATCPDCHGHGHT